MFPHYNARSEGNMENFIVNKQKDIFSKNFVVCNEEPYTERDCRIDKIVTQLTALSQAERDEVISTVLAIRRIGTTYRTKFFKKKDTLSLLQKSPKIKAFVRQLQELSQEESDEAIRTVLIRRDIELLAPADNPSLHKIGDGLYIMKDYADLEEVPFLELRRRMQSLWEKKTTS